MRSLSALAFGIVASLTLGAPAAAQDEERPLDPHLRSIEFGARITSASGDVARLMRFEDLRSGALVERARYTREKETRLVHFEVDRLGWRDQHLSALFASQM